MVKEECLICKAPLTVEPWGLSTLMTSAALQRIGAVGGPRCCKRDSYLAVLAAVDVVITMAAMCGVPCCPAGTGRTGDWRIPPGNRMPPFWML